jgi:hypothetical protein
MYCGGSYALEGILLTSNACLTTTSEMKGFLRGYRDFRTESNLSEFFCTLEMSSLCTRPLGIKTLILEGSMSLCRSSKIPS